jgi:hypothetical protein
MCGIFGFIQTASSRSRKDISLDLLKRLCLLSESRGKDASGIIGVSPQNIRTLKRSVRAAELLASREFDTFYQDTSCELGPESPCVYLGHTRMVTNGDSERHSNNQPCLGSHAVCIHNGIVVNDLQLNHSLELGISADTVDTQVIISLAERFYPESESFSDALKKVYGVIKGANSTAFVQAGLDNLFLASANGSLYVAESPLGDMLLFASERYIVEAVLEQRGLHIDSRDQFTVRQILPRTMCCISFCEPVLHLDYLSLEEARTVADTPASVVRGLYDYPPAQARQVYSKPYSGTYAELEALCRFDTSPIEEMRRCTKCLLPESFPFIEYDADGVCNYCHSYIPWKPQGAEAIREILEPVRSSKAPDCLVPVSGGRDSSYALHCICKELGMNPVAYTYDWGMVTDLARRNISRMCGELGIEHVLVSANIRQKRLNIRKNVLAWLKKPHLGAVTLFMAGDKPYYYYAYMLRRQMNIKYTLLGANHLERTDFKVGFCDIDERFGKDRHYSLNLVNKFRLLGFFGKQFLKNPSYLNASLLDTALGFASYYILPCDYISLYDYLPWDENVINDTLINTYDWETAPDTKSTWRIGDGTAAFYNYIYYKMAGFSENDTFRSNQIRQGILSREEGMELINSDNTPRVDSIKWYCDTIGIDPHMAIRAINAARTLYPK